MFSLVKMQFQGCCCNSILTTCVSLGECDTCGQLFREILSGKILQNCKLFFWHIRKKPSVLHFFFLFGLSNAFMWFYTHFFSFWSFWDLVWRTPPSSLQNFFWPWFSRFFSDAVHFSSFLCTCALDWRKAIRKFFGRRGRDWTFLKKARFFQIHFHIFGRILSVSHMIRFLLFWRFFVKADKNGQLSDFLSQMWRASYKKYILKFYWQ